MDSMTVFTRLKTVFAQALALPTEVEPEALEYDGSGNWDSVGHMRLVAALENEFGVLLETEQILDLSSFAKGLQILKSHGVAD